MAFGSPRFDARPESWRESSNAPHQGGWRPSFRVTHPFHPLFGQEYELIVYRHNWGEDRVYFQDSQGALCSLQPVGPMRWPQTRSLSSQPAGATSDGRTW